jgi:hypothetical protein
MRKQEQVAIGLVARHYSAMWETDGTPPESYVSIAGKRILIDVTNAGQNNAKWSGSAKARLRFDRVAVGLVRRLKDSLHESVPDERAVILTVSAPIRLPSKTAAALEDVIRTALVHRPVPKECKHTIHGNRVRVRLAKCGSKQESKVIGLVHNPDSDPDMLLDITESMLQCIGAAAGRPVPAGFAGDRWLVVVNEHGHSRIETYRQIYSQLSMPTDFTKILMLFAGGRVEILTERGAQTSPLGSERGEPSREFIDDQADLGSERVDATPKRRRVGDHPLSGDAAGEQP